MAAPLALAATAARAAPRLGDEVYGARVEAGEPEIEALGPELEIGVGYLFALGAAKADTDGMLRIDIAMEF